MTGKDAGSRISGDHSFTASPLHLLVFLALAVVAAAITAERYRTAPSVDFYHYWAVGKARRIAPDLRSPYREADRYAAALNSHVSEAGGWRLAFANRYRRTLDLTGTPLFYTAFSILPENYETAFRTFFILQVLLVVTGFGALGRILRRPVLPAAALGLAVVIAYEPFLSDMRVGNVNTFQFAVLAALAAVLGRRRERKGPVAASIPGVLAALILLKPNLVLVALAAAVCLALGSAGTSLRRSLLPGLLAALALLALPCLYFRSPAVWGDWLRLVTAGEGTRLVYPVAEGNFSLAAVVADRLRLPFPAAAGMVLTAVLLSFSAAFARGGAPWLKRCAADPFWSLSVAASTTVLLSPLAWVHYYMLLLLPSGWLLLGKHEIPGGIFLGAAALLFSSGLLSPVYAALGLLALEPATFAAGAVVTWAAALSALARPGSIVGRQSGGS